MSVPIQTHTHTFPDPAMFKMNSALYRDVGGFRQKLNWPSM